MGRLIEGAFIKFLAFIEGAFIWGGVYSKHYGILTVFQTATPGRIYTPVVAREKHLLSRGWQLKDVTLLGFKELNANY